VFRSRTVREEAICIVGQQTNAYFQSARNGPIRVMRFTSDMMDLPTVNVGAVADMLEVVEEAEVQLVQFLCSFVVN
jgi:hypothetical protein